MNTLHVYGQAQWHDEVYIVGDFGSLYALKEAIDRALVSGRDKCEQFTNDGEGYDINVIKTDEATMDKIGVPYHDEIAAERRETNPKYWEINKANITPSEGQ